MGLWSKIVSHFRSNSPKRNQAVCARVGESIVPPRKSVVRQCHRCLKDVTVAPLTYMQLGPDFDIICIQCAAAENPDEPIPPMSPEAIAVFYEHRGGYPRQIIKTVGEMNEYMSFLFPDRSKT